MKMLKQSIAMMKERKKPKFDLIIKNESKHLKRYLDKQAA